MREPDGGITITCGQRFTDDGLQVVATKEQLEFLDALRESGETNMFAATPFIESKFPDVTRGEARIILASWMQTFDARHPSGVE